MFWFDPSSKGKSGNISHPNRNGKHSPGRKCQIASKTEPLRIIAIKVGSFSYFTPALHVDGEIFGLDRMESGKIVNP